MPKSDGAKSSIVFNEQASLNNSKFMASKAITLFVAAAVVAAAIPPTMIDAGTFL